MINYDRLKTKPHELLAAARIQVEHTLAGVKRASIVKAVLRHTQIEFSDTVMEIAYALHNLRVHYRHPLPTLNLLDLCA